MAIVHTKILRSIMEICSNRVTVIVLPVAVNVDKQHT